MRRALHEGQAQPCKNQLVTASSPATNQVVVDTALGLAGGDEAGNIAKTDVRDRQRSAK